MKQFILYICLPVILFSCFAMWKAEASTPVRVGISQDGKAIFNYAFEKVGVVYEWEGNYILRLEAGMQRGFTPPNWSQEVIGVCLRAQRMGITDSLGIAIYDTLSQGGKVLASINCPAAK